MKILFPSQSYIPSRRASGVQVMAMCAAFAELGHQVTLVSKLCPARQEPGVADDHRFYGVPATFEIAKLPRPVLQGGGLVFAWAMGRLLRSRAADTDLIYSREPIGAWQAARRGLPTVFEAHGPPAGRRAQRLHRALMRSPALRRLVVISEALRSRLEISGDLPATADVVVAPDGATPIPAETGTPKATAPPGFDREGPHLGYIGQLYPGKGFELLSRLAPLLPGCVLHIVGGDEETLARIDGPGLPSNLLLHGFVPHSDLAAYYARFDILLMPYQRQVAGAGGGQDIAPWMSPLKMFEYMAAGRPTVSSDLPVLREVLEDGRNALLVPPDDPMAWRRAIERLLADGELRHGLAATAREDLVRRYTWQARARRVLEGIEGDGGRSCRE